MDAGRRAKISALAREIENLLIADEQVHIKSGYVFVGNASNRWPDWRRETA